MSATTYSYKVIVVSRSDRVIIADEDTGTIFIQNHIKQWICIGLDAMIEVSPELVLSLGEMKRAAISLNKVMEVMRERQADPDA